MGEGWIRDDTFFRVEGWMRNRLKLKGTALQVFAIIYGFSQSGESSFNGSLGYLCDFTGTSKNTVIKTLKELVARGYVVKQQTQVNGASYIVYEVNEPVVQKLHGGGAKTAPGGGEETAPNKIIHEKIGYKNDSMVDEIVGLYHSICVSYPKVETLTQRQRTRIQRLLESYGKGDFETVFVSAENSRFLKGSKGGWRATFDWLIQEGNFLKVRQGNYRDRPKRTSGNPLGPGWQPSLGQAELEAIQRVLREEPV